MQPSPVLVVVHVCALASTSVLSVIQDVITAAFQQRPFTTAAVCEAAVRGAARHNSSPAGNIHMFASFAANACREVAATPGSGSSSIVAAAVSDSSTRDALLLQFALITTQLKYAAAGAGRASFFTNLFYHVMPVSRAVAGLGNLIQRTVGLNTQHSDAGSSSVRSSSGSSGVEEQRERVRVMLPWIHLCGRCLFCAGSQLLLAMENGGASTVSWLNASTVKTMEQVCHFQSYSSFGALRAESVGRYRECIQSMRQPSKCVLEPGCKCVVVMLHAHIICATSRCCSCMLFVGCR
jgi:hypothetical protein